MVYLYLMYHSKLPGMQLPLPLVNKSEMENCRLALLSNATRTRNRLVQQTAPFNQYQMDPERRSSTSCQRSKTGTMRWQTTSRQSSQKHPNHFHLAVSIEITQFFIFEYFSINKIVFVQPNLNIVYYLTNDLLNICIFLQIM